MIVWNFKYNVLILDLNGLSKRFLGTSILEKFTYYLLLIVNSSLCFISTYYNTILVTNHFMFLFW